MNLSTNRHSCEYSFHGFHVRLTSNNQERLSDIHTDFSHFHIQETTNAQHPDLEIRFHNFSNRPSLPRLPASQHTPRNVVYRDAATSYLDYGGRALARISEHGKKIDVYSDDRHLAHEAVYLTILAYTGEYFDRTGRTRVHALGLETAGQAVLLMLPSSGGKTTMALKMLQVEGVKLLSEDSPLMLRNGLIEPFPIRIGLRPGTAVPDIDPAFQLDIERMEFGPKKLIDIEAFHDKLSGPVPISAILLGTRFSSGDSRIMQVSRRQAFRPLISDAVVGLGLYQGVEFVLKSSALELLGKGRLAFARLRNSLGVLRRANVYRFEMGTDIEQTANTLETFLEQIQPKTE